MLNHEKPEYGVTTVTEVTVSEGKLLEVQNGSQGCVRLRGV